MSALSCGPPLAIPGNEIKRAAITFERGLLTAHLLPTLDHNIGILGIEFEPAADTLGCLRRRERRSASPKGVIYKFAPPLLSWVAFHVAGGLIHVLLIVAVISLVLHIFRGRRSA